MSYLGYLKRLFVSKWKHLGNKDYLNFHVDQIIKATYRGKTLGIITLSGWCHISTGKLIPDLAIFCDGKFLHKLKLHVPRKDVIAVYGECSFPNGFSKTFKIPDNCKTLHIVEKNSNTTLYKKEFSKIKTEDLSEIDYNSWGLIEKIPLNLRQKLDLENENYELSANAASMFASHILMLKYLCRPEEKMDGYNIIGYISGVIGLGEASRAFIDFMLEKKENLVLLDFFEPTHSKISSREESKYIPYYFQPFKYKTNIFLLDTFTVSHLRSNLPEIFENKKNITSFWWEFESGFEDRIPILDGFDEVLVFSDFIKNTLNKVENKKFKVTKIKYPFYRNWEIEEDIQIIRERYNLTNKFCFFFNFDYASGFRRKNPEASLKAFYEEFPNEKDVVFVFKTNNLEGFNEKTQKFKSLIDRYKLTDRVIVISESLSKNGFMSVLNAMDCYVSLHRGEGLGLGILEAYALQKNVIATNFGGNAEYMDHPLGHPVNFTLVPAHDDYIVYKDVKEWAEPDIDHAKKLMRKVYTQLSRQSAN